MCIIYHFTPISKSYNYASTPKTTPTLTFSKITNPIQIHPLQILSSLKKEEDKVSQVSFSVLLLDFEWKAM